MVQYFISVIGLLLLEISLFVQGENEVGWVVGAILLLTLGIGGLLRSLILELSRRPDGKR